METNSNNHYEFKVYPNTKSPKLFKNPILEVLTKTKLWIIVTTYSLVSAIWIAIYVVKCNGSAVHSIGLFVLGFFSWTFLEYALHRWLYHKIKDSSYDSGLQYMFHGIHHEFPSDEDRIILPPVPGLVIAHLLLLVFYLIFDVECLTLGAGFLMGYLAYISIHWMVHSKPVPEKFNFWWTHHNIHHYQQHDRAFGVSTPIWDYVFHTMPEKGRKTITILRQNAETRHHQH